MYIQGLSNRDLSYQALSVLLTQPQFYLIIISTTLIGIVPNVLRLCVKRMICPDYYQILQEVYANFKSSQYGEKRRIVIEGSNEGHQYFADISKPKPLFSITRKSEAIELED
ncbi:hypothetical protein QTN25_009901 [Entamoeba marina]